MECPHRDRPEERHAPRTKEVCKVTPPTLNGHSIDVHGRLHSNEYARAEWLSSQSPIRAKSITADGPLLFGRIQFGAFYASGKIRNIKFHAVGDYIINGPRDHFMGNARQTRQLPRGDSRIHAPRHLRNRPKPPLRNPHHSHTYDPQPAIRNMGIPPTLCKYPRSTLGNKSITNIQTTTSLEDHATEVRY